MRSLTDGQIYQEIGMKTLDPEACAAVDRIHDEITQAKAQEHFNIVIEPPARKYFPSKEMLLHLLLSDEYKAKIRKEYFSDCPAREKIMTTNLCKEIPIGTETHVCVIGLFEPIDAIAKLPYNLFAHVDVKMRQAFAPEGKLVQDSWSGYTLKDHTPEEIEETNLLIEKFHEVCSVLTKEQIQTFYYGILVARYSVINGANRSHEWFTRAYLKYTEYQRTDAKLPVEYSAWVDKKLPIYDTECNPKPEWRNLKLNPDINICKSFKRDELILIDSFITPETRWKASNPIAKLKQQLASGEEVVMYDTEATITDEDLEKYSKNLGIEMNPEANVDRLYTNSEFGAIAERSEVYEEKEVEAIERIEADFPKRRKRSKSKKRSKHITNCKKGFAHQLMGMSILAKLGKHQQDFQDGVKREILKNHTLSSFVETVSGQAIPEYQKRLLDLNQQRHDNPLSDAPLTDEQIEVIREASSATDLPDSAFDQRLFGETVNGTQPESSTVQIEERADV